MNRKLKSFSILLLSLLTLASCKDSDSTPDPRHDWQSRNAQWFTEVYDAAKASIAQAKAQYPNGNDWQEHCEWRLYKTLMKSQDVPGTATDYIVCKVNPPYRRDVDEGYATYTDSVRLYYRAWIMDENYPESKTNMTVFSQSYYGNFDETKVAPIAMPVISTVEGFMTALQYMVKGDDWDIYIPQELAYKGNASDYVPAYSTLLYHVRIESVHKSGTGLSEWR